MSTRRTGRLRRLDDIVLDDQSRIRVGFLAGAAGLVFAVALGLLAVVLAVISVTWGYAPGVIVAALLLLAAVVFAAGAVAALYRHRRRP